MRHLLSLRWRRSSAILLALLIALVVLADWLFFRRPIGWTAGLYLALLVLALGVRARGWWGGSAGVALAALLAGLAVAFALDPGPLPTLLAILGVPALALVSRSGWTHSLLAWLGRAIWFVVNLPLRPLFDLAASERWARRRRQLTGRFPSLARWIVPVALSLVFVALFWIANPVVASWIRRAWDALDDFVWRFGDIVGPLRILFWIAAAVVLWTLLRIRARRIRVRGAAAIASGVQYVGNAAADRILSTAVVVRCLLLFNAIFLAQTVLDLTYLWGGAALPDGMTYAEYAHRGAYPLVATALLAGAFVLVTFRSGGPAERSPLARRLVYLWVAQNILLLASAAWRLRLYVDVYSLTMWRIAAAVWMLLVALGLAWTVYRIARGHSNVWLLRINVCTALAVLYLCCFPDFAGFIATFNARHCREAGGPGVAIDLPYLESLGPAALPALHWLQQNTHDPSILPQTTATIARLHTNLDADLTDWRGWTWRRSRLAVNTPAAPYASHHPSKNPPTPPTAATGSATQNSPHAARSPM